MAFVVDQARRHGRRRTVVAAATATVLVLCLLQGTGLLRMLRTRTALIAQNVSGSMWLVAAAFDAQRQGQKVICIGARWPFLPQLTSRDVRDGSTAAGSTVGGDASGGEKEEERPPRLAPEELTAWRAFAEKRCG